MIDQNRLKRFSIILFILTLIVLVIHMESLVRFNRQEFLIHGNEATGGIQMEINARQDSTSSWLKRSFLMDDGKAVNLTGQTIDGTFYNQSGDTIDDWELRINIKGNCFINQAWNGEVEIHQYVGSDEETVQRMNLQNYDLEDVTFDYRYDGDLLIPLREGDYVIYYPNTRFSEMPIGSGDEVKIGMIFYYLNELDLSDYDVRLHFHRNFTQGITFYGFVALGGLLLLFMVMTVADALAYRRAMKEMELRKSGIFSMSDIYDLIYIIHLPTGEMTPVSVDERIERERPKNQTAKEVLTNLIREDVAEKSRDLMLEFVDTDTLPERLKERNSVAGEFYSDKYGWYEIRFYAMDRVEGKPIENVVFTVQNISEEKKEQEAIIHRIEEAKSFNEAKAAFMDNLADDLQQPLKKLAELNERIVRESGDEAVRGYALSANSTVDRLLVLTDGLVDTFGAESGQVKLNAQPYSLRQLLIDLLRTMLPLADQKRIAMTLDVTETLPDRLEGDPRVLREILVPLVSGLMHDAEGGSAQLAVYGKALEGRVHLLFSARLLSDSVRKGEASGPEEFTGLTGLSMEVVSGLLAGMGSTLKSVRAPEGRRELYFEIDQPVLDAAPIGKLTIEDIG